MLTVDFDRLGLRPGDRVILLPGDYPDTRISVTGTAEQPIRIEAAQLAVAADGSAAAAGVARKMRRAAARRMYGAPGVGGQSKRRGPRSASVWRWRARLRLC